MSENIMLSVIVPVYNAETFLPESLDSLLKVRLDEPYEIIAVDDGSADGTPEILRAYAEEHEHIRILTKKNGGVSRARNTGIEEARGNRLNAIRPGCSRRESADPEELMEWFFGREEILTYSVWSKVYRRELVEKVRFAPGVRVAEDLKFLFDVLMQQPKVLVLDMDAYNYVIREESVMHSRYAELGWDAMKILDGCEAETGYPEIRKHIRKRKTDVLVRIYNTALLNGTDTGKALQAVRETDTRDIRDEM